MAELRITPLINNANLIHYYTLEDVDDDKGSVDLTNGGTVAFNAAKFNNGADFGTSNSTKSLSTTNTVDIDGGNISISCWVKLQTEIASGNYVLVHQGNNTSKTQYKINYNYNSGTQRIEAIRNKSGVASAVASHDVTMGTSNYFHIVLTYDGSNVELFVDNVSRDTAASSGSGSGATTDGFAIGADADLNNKSSAIIDDVAVFSDELTSAEISALFNELSTGFLNLL